MPRPPCRDPRKARRYLVAHPLTAKFSLRAADYSAQQLNTRPLSPLKFTSVRWRAICTTQPLKKTKSMYSPSTALIVVIIMGLAAGTAASQDANKTAPTVKHVMATMTVPASDVIFTAASEPPKDEQQWVALRASAATLAESGRLLVTNDNKHDAEWVKMARALVTEAEATFEAIDAKNPDALMQAGDSLYLTCETCHARYMAQ